MEKYVYKDREVKKEGESKSTLKLVNLTNSQKSDE